MSPLEEYGKSITAGGFCAVMAAVAFGITTPLIQKFGQGAGAIPTATVLYAGAALASLGAWGRGNISDAPLRRRHFGRVTLVALVGAVVAPAFFAWGLQHTSGTGASLLLNFEGLMTVGLARLFFNEPMGRRIVLAMVVMSLGGACLAVGGNFASVHFGWGAMAVIVATLGWAFDNTLTRPLADLDPAQVVRWKGALGSAFGLGLSILLNEPFPRFWPTVALLACGATGFGLSLRLYLSAQRKIGAGRTGSIFALAPFVGAFVAWAMGAMGLTVDRTPGPATFAAGGLFALGVILHLTEQHRHPHVHESLVHEHSHRHDDHHHDHFHDPPVIREHSHAHRHAPVSHDHGHAPDLHHSHRHR